LGNVGRSLHACRQLPHGVFYKLLATSSRMAFSTNFWLLLTERGVDFTTQTCVDIRQISSSYRTVTQYRRIWNIREMAINKMDISSTKYNGQSSSRFYNHQYSIIAEINRALDSQESGEVEDPRQNTGPIAESDVKSPSQHLYEHHVHGYDTEFPGPHPVEPATPDFTTRFEYWTFSRSELMCRQTPCEGHPPEPTQSSAPTLLSVSEIKVEVRPETT
jgi:hypothetical protein